DVDLFHSPADAIGSVANYLAAHGWAEGPILLEATVTRDPTPLLSGGLALDRTIAELRAAGVVVEGAGDDARARLFKFDGPSGPEYRVGLQNFYVITRYNRSPLYARAVTELAASY
ncbi:MAG TPA: lytic murein transglycosylase B, partial [Deltaproteobacteria bacterium]|nr:lytic murein transglycosylase B [Deltaproteobacteria bacterium]